MTPSMAIETATDAVIKAHVHNLILNGTLTVNEPINPRDISRYLESAKFMKYTHSIHSMAVKMMSLPAPEPEKE